MAFSRTLASLLSTSLAITLMCCSPRGTDWICRRWMAISSRASAADFKFLFCAPKNSKYKIDLKELLGLISTESNPHNQKVANKVESNHSAVESNHSAMEKQSKDESDITLSERPSCHDVVCSRTGNPIKTIEDFVKHGKLCHLDHWVKSTANYSGVGYFYFCARLPKTTTKMFHFKGQSGLCKLLGLSTHGNPKEKNHSATLDIGKFQDLEIVMSFDEDSWAGRLTGSVVMCSKKGSQLGTKEDFINHIRNCQQQGWCQQVKNVFSRTFKNYCDELLFLLHHAQYSKETCKPHLLSSQRTKHSNGC